MQPTINILQLTILCALFVFSSGCQQRYKPSKWKAAKRLSASEAQAEMGDESSKVTFQTGLTVDGSRGGGVLNPWSSMPLRAIGGSTLPGRGWSTLPGRGWSTLPGRGWSTLPGRAGSTLPQRGWSTLPTSGAGEVKRGWSPLPARGWSTIPTRGASTLPVRRGARGGLGGLELPRPLVDPQRRLDLPGFKPLRSESTLPSRRGNPLR